MFKSCLTAILFIFSQKAVCEDISEAYINEVFKTVSQEVEVPENLLRAICFSESAFNPRAYNHGDGKGDNHAFGICQVLRVTAEELGFKDPNCAKDFSDTIRDDGRLVKTVRDYNHCKLFGVYTNVLYGAKYLKSRLVQYNDSWISAIAAYNSGTVRICKTGKVRRLKDNTVLWTCKKGGILNQKYVDGVLKALQEGR